MNNQLEPLLRLSIKVSIEAGKEVMRIYNGEVVFVMKSDSSPLTLADISSHRIISEGLLTTKIPILSEEGKEIPYEIRSKWEYLWLIDPLDGTKEFKKRNGEFTTLVYDFFIQITA
ncbi:MAG: 3'(2'),5'-bisphosphate nucleotidase CysQ [Caldimicrobium sp.]